MKAKGSEIVKAINMDLMLRNAIGFRGGESAFAIEMHIASEHRKTMLMCGETRHVLIEKDFAKLQSE